MAVAMLSLATNPYDPFEDYELWSLYDRHEGFDTGAFLGRLVGTSEFQTPAEEERATEDAIDSVLANPAFEGLYKKVIRKD